MSFKLFKFHPDINQGILDIGFTRPTPIQKEAIPSVMDGKDVLGLAQTGTGKTAAFVLPILQHLLTADAPKNRAPRALIMAPTRELADQINENIKELGQHTCIQSLTVYGGVSKAPQLKALKRGVDILVACPGRLLDLMGEGAVSLDHIRVLVLDEADQMLDMGFLPDIRRIIKRLPQKRQSLVFSATMPNEIKSLIQEILDRPVTVRVNQELATPQISHTRFEVQKQERTSLLKQLFAGEDMDSALVFTRTKHKAKSLAIQLKKAGFKAASLQGNLTQSQRRRAMDGFRNGAFKILVATDIAARGIDVTGVSHVINYDLPDTVETYIHRTGRTGRAERSGQAYTFSGEEDRKMISRIEKAIGKKMMANPLPQT